MRLSLPLPLLLAISAPAAEAFSISPKGRTGMKIHETAGHGHGLGHGLGRPLYAEGGDSDFSIDIDDDGEFDAPSDVDVDVDVEYDATAAMEEEIQMSEETQAKLLQKLLVASSTTDRGQFATDAEKKDIETIIRQFETSAADGYGYGYDEPTKAPCIEGTWELLYSNTQLFRSSPFFMAGRAVCQTEEEAMRYDWFCDMHRGALAISEIGKVRQIVSNDRLVSEFEVRAGAVPFLNDLTPFSYSGGLPFVIEGAIVSSADITPTSDGNAWEIYMDQVEIKGSNIPLLRNVLDAENVSLQSRKLAAVLEDNVSGYTTPKPIFQTTFLNDMIRISRDQDGKVFVYGKTSDSTLPTDYKSVEADLGVLKLLEGLNDNFFKISI